MSSFPASHCILSLFFRKEVNLLVPGVVNAGAHNSAHGVVNVEVSNLALGVVNEVDNNSVRGEENDQIG